MRIKLKVAERKTHESTLIGLRTLKHDEDDVISGERLDGCTIIVKYNYSKTIIMSAIAVGCQQYVCCFIGVIVGTIIQYITTYNAQSMRCYRERL